MANNKGKNTEATLATNIVAGLGKHIPVGTTLTFGGGTFTPAQIITRLQLLVALRTAVTAAQATAKAKVADEAAQGPAIRAMMIALVAFLKAMFAGQPDVLADFGLPPKKARTPLTAAKQAAANAKRQATREARGVIGTQKRKAIKGAVTGVVVTPVEAAPAATVAATTAANGGGTPKGA
jgi:hypothetical protein